MSFAGGAAVFAITIVLLQRPCQSSTCEQLSIDRVTLHDPRPGEFFGNSTIPNTCTGAQSLSCDTSPITDGDFGDTSSGVRSSEFMAWRNNSNIIINRIGTDTLLLLRSMKVYFYHDRTVGAGLPQFDLSGSTSEIVAGTPIPYTILGNQDLAAGDAQVRNVTLALLLGTDIVGGNRFHIQFFLMSGIEVFAISEIELCTDAATVEAEALVLELSSEPKQLVNGSTVRLPANRTGVTENSVIRLSCTVSNQGRFQWSWSVPDSLSPPTQLLLDATRTSMIEVPQNEADLGEYMCTASYHTDTGLNPSSVTETFTVEAQLELYPEERHVSIDSNLVLLDCILAGEFSGSGNIQWSYNGQLLRDGDKYQVFTANNIDCTYGKCHRSQLQIRQANANDVGTYTCSFVDMSEDITVMNTTSLLYPEERSVSIDSNLVLLGCILAGEFSGNGNIQWSYNGQTIIPSDKYQVFTVNNIDCTYGKCHRSQLQIRQANANDVGTYTCSFEDMSEDITVMNPTLVLYADEKIVNIVSNFVLLECILAGEFSGNGNIEWLYNSQLLRQGDKYQVFTADNVGCTYYGKCHRSQLQIRPANANDVGTYTCSFEDMSEDITVVTNVISFPPHPRPTNSPTTSSSQPCSTVTVPALIGVTLVALFV